MHGVVLVDDHSAVLLALTSLLERDADLKIVGTATDGTHGLRLCRELQPDLLVVDIDIPGLNGLDLIRRIRVTDSTVKIIVMSGYAAELFAPRCQSAGANAYMSKSDDVMNVLNVAKVVLAGFNCFRADVNVTLGEGAPDAALASLTERELTVLRYLAKGESNKEIGDALSLSNKTIGTHKANIMAKLGLTNIVDLAAFAKAHQLI
jgi:two-component system response regulator EvgA